MNTGRNRATGGFHGDAPEITEAERKRDGLGHGRVVQVVTVVFEIFEKLIIVFAAEALEEVGSDSRDVDEALCLFIPQALGSGFGIATKIGVGLDRRAVRMKRIY